MKTTFLVILSVLNFLPAFSQSVIQGKVYDSKTKKAIQNVSIYINNTSIGMKTNNLGAFRLYPQQAYKELVASAIGYEKVVIKINSISTDYKIYLDEKENVLPEFNFNYDKKAWDKWWAIFKKVLLGGNFRFTSKCKILNPKDVIFFYDKQEKSLKVTFRNKLRIQNANLGYILNVDVDKFEYFLVDDKLIYESTVQYEDLTENFKKKIL